MLLKNSAVPFIFWQRLSGSLKDRLKSATFDIGIAPSTDLPPNAKEELEELKKLLLVQTKGKTEMTADELRRFTDRLVALCFQMLREQREQPG